MPSITDIQSFNQLFNEYYESFIRFAQGYIYEREQAEDFVSESFAQFWENRDNLLPDTHPKAYILTIVKNKCLNHLHHIQVKQRTEKMINDHEEWRLSVSINTLQACNPEFLFSEEIQQIINTTLKKLPKQTQQIFNLSRFEGLTYKQIAEKKNLSTKSIEFHISKALSQLRLSLKDFIYILFILFYFS